MPSRRRYFVLSLGCAKNTVDSDSMAALLERAGLSVAAGPARADVVIVNTCGFIGPAREESLAALRELAAAKKPGQWLIAAGCLTQRSGAEVARAVPGVDAVLGTRHWMEILAVIDRLGGEGGVRPMVFLPTEDPTPSVEIGIPRVAVRGSSAYIKIADGCDRTCAFCAIPQIKGPARSRPPEDVAAEAASLQAKGVRELVLLAQDTTAYGRDLGLPDGLSQLLARLAREAPAIDWIRILYAFPGAIDDRLIDTMAALPQVVPYLDLPLQHADPAVLRRMRRPADLDWVRRTVGRMRERLPGLAVRTAFIVGFPGETEAEFAALLDFLREMRFDRVGCFLYSHEAGTPAGNLRDDVSPAEKERRRGALMELQQGISLEKNREWVGRSLDVLIEGREKGLAVGRSFRDAPEVDGVVLVQGRAPAGAMIRARVVEALPYDLVAVPER